MVFDKKASIFEAFFGIEEFIFQINNNEYATTTNESERYKGQGSIQLILKRLF